MVLISKSTSLACLFLLCFAMLAIPATAQESTGHEEEESHSDSRFSDEPIPLADMPERPKPIVEVGEPFLGTGTLKPGLRLPTGAVWQPAFLAFGTLRSAIQNANADLGNDFTAELTEAAFRFDLFGNLYLTSSERFLIGFRPLDQNGQFTRYTLDTNLELGEDDFVDELNFGIRTLFFEGDIGELFPAADWNDSKGLDIGISIGRQPLSFQDGMLLNEDAIDMIGLTKANVKFSGLVNTRIAAILGWGDIDRPVGIATFDPTLLGVNVGDKSATLLGFFGEIDSRKTTMEADVVFVFADDIQGSGFYAGLGSTRRFGRFSNTWRAVLSTPIGDEGLHNSQGVLLSNQFSWTPHHTHNHVYINLFLGIQEFRSAARGPSTGGPLGRTGILFSAVGIGRLIAPLGNLADNAYGGSFGYQFFFAHTRQQLILEVGGRANYGDSGIFQNDAVAGGARYQIAIGRRGVVVLDGFGIYEPDIDAFSTASRVELLIKL